MVCLPFFFFRFPHPFWRQHSYGIQPTFSKVLVRFAAQRRVRRVRESWAVRCNPLVGTWTSYPCDVWHHPLLLLLLLLLLLAAASASATTTTTTLGNTSPFFPGIRIFPENHQNFFLGGGNSDRFLERTMVEKNGDSTPRTTAPPLRLPTFDGLQTQRTPNRMPLVKSCANMCVCVWRWDLPPSIDDFQADMNFDSQSFVRAKRVTLGALSEIQFIHRASVNKKHLP